MNVESLNCKICNICIHLQYYIGFHGRSSAISFKTSSEGRLHYGSEEASAELGSTRLNTDAEDDVILTLLLSGHSRCGGYRPGAK